MCGLLGFVGASGSEAALAEQAAKMSREIRHRGPDSDGLWVDAAAGVALAHRRLAILDLTSGGHQPMLSASGRHVIAFNGEIYNFAEIRRTLEREGAAPQWRGSSDTEVLLAAIEAWGIRRAIEAATGMFAFAVWDRKARGLTLAVDRFGEKPLYFGRLGGTFLFASELSALKRHADWRGEIDRDALAEFIRLGYVPAPFSIYRNVRKLGPGTLLELRYGDAEAHIETYWSATETAEAARRDPFLGGPEDAVEEAGRRLTRAVEGQMVADVPLGAFLSGGLDSSLVVATMQSLTPRRVKTYTIGFEDASYDEAKHAAAIARHLKTEHTELYVNERDALDVVPKLASIYSEPFADASQIPTYLVSKLARESVSVALSGDGGDEVFSGYDRYRIAGASFERARRVPRPARHAAARALEKVPASVLETAGGGRFGERAAKLARVLKADSVEDAYQALISHWPRPEEVVIGALRDDAPRGLEASSLDGLRRMMLADITGYLPGDILAKVDRAAMAVSLETRMPFLDHRLVEFSFHLPTEILRRGGQSKWITRELLARHLPRPLFERPKQGFSVPLAQWLRGPLRAWAEALIAPERLKREGFLDPAPIRAAWSRHLAGRTNAAGALWPLLIFQSWLAHEEAAGR